MSEPGEHLFSEFQLTIASIFFSLPESEGFLLAGGGALIAQRLVNRVTDDLDFFASRALGDVEAACNALIKAVAELGWSAAVIRSAPEFRRVRIDAEDAEPEQIFVDLALDSPPNSPPTITIAGPAYSPYELAIRKTLAVFGRAEARDLTDLYGLHQQFDRGEILREAMKADPGFDLRIFIEMLRAHRRLKDVDFPYSGMRVNEIREYFDDWADKLERGDT